MGKLEDIEFLLDSLQSCVQEATSVIKEQGVTDLEVQRSAIRQALLEMERAGVPAPEAMLTLNQRLDSELDAVDQARDTVNLIKERVDQLLFSLSDILPRTNQAVRRGRRSGGRVGVMMTEIIELLRNFGGSLTRSEVFRHYSAAHSDDFTEEELEIAAGGRPLWQVRLNEARRKLMRQGTLDADAPLGVWQLKQPQ